jgi:hypothetical protein
MTAGAVLANSRKYHNRDQHGRQRRWHHRGVLGAWHHPTNGSRSDPGQRDDTARSVSDDPQTVIPGTVLLPAQPKP